MRNECGGAWGGGWRGWGPPFLILHPKKLFNFAALVTENPVLMQRV